MSSLALLFVACGGDDPATDDPEAQFRALGRRIYLNQCATCHQPDGGGVPEVYPTLHQTEWIAGDKGRLIRLTLNGLHGPIEVKGQTYNNVMTPHAFLNDVQIAAVLTYVRQHFGNEADAVTPDEVTAVRLANTQDGPWEANALWEATGIPDTTLSTAMP